MQDTILILGNDLSLTGLIAHTLRLQQVYALQMPLQTPVAEGLSAHPRGIILAPAPCAGKELALLDPGYLTAGIPLLALEELAVALCLHFGGEASAWLGAPQAVTLWLAEHPLFEEMTGGEHILRNLSQLTLPAGLTPLARATERVIGFGHGEQPLYGLQYPIEHNDPEAARLLLNFATGVCGAQATWEEHAIIKQAVDQIREAAGEDRVLCAVSGGVDSMVCAKLVQMAVGDQLHCVFVDTGLLREGEADWVMAACKEHLGVEIHRMDAQDAFLRAMAGVSSPADKERITLTLLKQIFRKELIGDPTLKVLALGTNWDDILYRGSGALASDEENPEEGGCRWVEPLRALFKDEVRHVGAVLSLPSAIVNQQAFPSSGLALRIMGEVTPQRLALLRKADAVFVEELTSGGHEKKLRQYYATLWEAPLDPGSYVIALRALQAAQECAYPARLPFDLLERVTQRVLDSVPGVSRVIYDLTPGMHNSEQE